MEPACSSQGTSRNPPEGASNQLGPIVVVIGKLPRTSNGTILEGWENRKMCSNPRHGCNAGSQATDKPATMQVQGGLPAGYPRGNPLVDEYKDFWAEDGPWTVDDAFGHQ